MFKTPVISGSKKYVIVTQKKVREDTSHMAIDAPKTWCYFLISNIFLKGKAQATKMHQIFLCLELEIIHMHYIKLGLVGFIKNHFSLFLLHSTEHQS